MKRVLLISAVLLLSCFNLFAAHIIGGEMRYTYLGPGASPNTSSYRIVMLLFRDRGGGGAALANSYVIGIYNNDNGQKVIGPSANGNWDILQDPPGQCPPCTPVPILLPTCITNPPALDYEYATYSMVIDLPHTSTGYTIAYQTCCRVNGIMNVGNSTGATYSCVIPGTNAVPGMTDSSPQFGLPVNVICQSPATFSLNFSASDQNSGDSLSYRLCNAYNGGAAIDAGFNNPAPPPYGSVNYLFPYTAADPFGTGAGINSQTGIISGNAPGAGKYVVCVCVDVYRNGVYITTHRKDLIVQVSDCQIPVAQAMPSFVTCDGFNIQFSESSTGAQTYFWDFGDPTTLADTSNLPNPTYVYTDTGLYRVKFVINRGTSCADSTFRTVGVYPGFFPGFTHTGSCFTNPFQFNDTTNTSYGFVDSWSWNFGDPSTLGDTSHIQNPSWTYAAPGTNIPVTLIVTNSKGCIDTTTTNITVFDKPPIALAFRDTLICRNDAVQLSASGTGSWTWTPNTNISNPNSANPTVNPTSTTWYFVQLNDAGCVNRDSVQVRVVPNVSLQARSDTTICFGDSVQLSANTNGLSFQWTPAVTLNDPTIVNPIATPDQPSITYQVTATIGSCSATDDVTINTVPYPLALAGPDDTACYNTPIQLNASHDGTSFTWSPTIYLSNPNVLNPIVNAPRTTRYIFTVRDTLSGCPKPVSDTVTVVVMSKLRPFAGRDTTVVIYQPLQFNASGGVTYFWTPSTGLNDPNIPDPVGIYGPEIDSVRYKLIVSDAAGCPDSAFVTVRVFKTVPSIFVPTAFTPNGDGLNDVVRPIGVGIQKINYFSIYNRWGQLVFRTSTNFHGWDGKINGREQGSAVFVWIVSAIDYLGKKYFAKGTVTLIR